MQPLQASPNHSPGNVALRFSRAGEESFSLRVYDLRGALVHVLGAGLAHAGETYPFTWDGSLPAESLYLVRLVAPSQVQTVKVILHP